MEIKSSWSTGFGKLATRSAQTLLVLALLVVIFFALVQLKMIVIPVIIAIILASTMFPLVSFMERFRINRGVGSFLAIAISLGLLAVVGNFIVRSIGSQWTASSSSLIAKFEEAGEWLYSGAVPLPVEQIDELMNSGRQYLTSSSFGHEALQASGTIASIFAGVFLTLITLFFFLKDGNKIFLFLLGFLKPSIRQKTNESGIKAVTVLGGYFRGTALVGLIDAVLIGAGLLIMDVPLVLPLCLLVIIGVYIPYIGSISSSAIITLVALVTTDVSTAVVVAIIVLTVNQVEGLLSPLVLGNILKMSALAILLALAIGATLGGIIGALLAVPIASVGWVFWSTWNKPRSIVSIASEVEEPVIEEDAPTSED